MGSDSDVGLKVGWPAIRRRLRQNGNDSVYVIVKIPGVTGSPEDLLADTRSAMDRANTAMDRDGEELIWAQSVIPSSKGPMVDLDWIGTDEQTQEWLDTFAETLNGLGWAGKITAAPQVFFPEDMDDDMRHTCLTCYVALTVDDPTGYFAGGQGQWLADAELTREWCDYAAGWAILPGATTYLSEATSRVIVDDPRPARELMTAAQRSAQATVVNLVPNPYRARFLSFDFHARITFQSGAAADGTPTPDWRDQLPSVTEALLHRPACLDYGLILPQWALGGGGFGSYPNKRPAPYVDDGLYGLNRHLWGTYVPDAYAIQVITRDHLDKAHDLSEWSVTEVAYERYLVQARDLGAWWDDPEPSPEIIDRARQDFGAMITTYDVIQADPHGWLPGRGRKQVL